MKLNKILMALSAMAIVGCSSEDFNDPSVTQAIDDSRLIQLDENFVLAGVGEVGNTTRTHWEKDGKNLVNVFLPIWKAAPNGGLISDYANLERQAVGLCWLGNGDAGTNVYTNYEFYHFGWLNNGATEANFECDKLTNGALYDEITVASGDAAGAEADTTKFTLPAQSTTTRLNYNSGVYKTDNKAIFGGDYIVYYPFNPNFKEAGTIPATAETNWVNVPTALTDSVLGHATFRYSAPVTIKGGDKAADFGLKNLSALVQLRVAAAKGYETPQDANEQIKFDQIVLYSANEQLLKQANLAADKIAAGATELYAGTEGTKTITATFGTPATLYATDAKENNQSLVTSAYITVLPTTVEDLVVLVHSSSLKKWAKVSLPNTEFKAGAAKRLDITVAEDDFKADFIAVDEASLKQALEDAREAVGNIADPKPQTITVIGDITLKAEKAAAPIVNPVGNFNINADEDAFITIKGDKIIVPEDVLLRVKTNIESDIRVLGKSCCSGAKGGMLYVQGGMISNVTMEPTGVKKELTPEDYDKYNPLLYYTEFGPSATVAAGKTIDVQAGRVSVGKAVQHKGNIQIAEGAKLTVSEKGDLQFMGSNVTNNGIIEVLKKGKFDMTDANGNAHATDGQRMTNNGKFIHNVDAGVGTAVQSMNQNGEYRCKVNGQEKLNDAFLQWTACSVIEMVEAGTNYNLGTAASIPTKADGAGAYKHKGKYIDIEVNTTGETTFTNPAPDHENIMIRNLTVTKGGLNIDYINKVGEKTDKRTLTVNGDMVVKATTTITDSKKINVKENLTVEGAQLLYKGAKANEDGLEVTKDITVSGAAGNFDASEVNAIKIKCANFYLTDKAKATFGNRTGGTDKTMTVTGTISNPKDCTFGITAASDPNLLAWITCTELLVGGNWTGARPIVE